MAMIDKILLTPKVVQEYLEFIKEIAESLQSRLILSVSPKIIIYYFLIYSVFKVLSEKKILKIDRLQILIK